MLTRGLKALTVMLALHSLGGLSPLGGWGHGRMGVCKRRGAEARGVPEGAVFPYHLDINLLDGGGSADIIEHYRPSKVSIRSAAKVADRSLPYYFTNECCLKLSIRGSSSRFLVTSYMMVSKDSAAYITSSMPSRRSRYKSSASLSGALAFS